MYIEKLTEYEIEYIAKELLLIVEHSDKTHVENLILGSEIEIESHGIRIILPITSEEEIFLGDFTASISYGSHNSKDSIIKTFRKFMYGKFGERYKKDLLEHYKKPIQEKYEKALIDLNNEINDMIQ